MKTTPRTRTIASTCKVFGCTPEQAKAQMRRNLAQLESMKAKAEKTGRLVNGYSADDLGFMASKVRKGWGL